MCWEGLGGEKERGRTSASWCGVGMGEACACGEKMHGKGEAMQAALLRDLDAGKSSGEEGAFREAAVRHVCKWNKLLQSEGRREKWRGK